MQQAVNKQARSQKFAMAGVVSEKGNLTESVYA